MDPLEDLIKLLSNPNAEVKQQAVELVQGLTGSPEGISQLVSQRDALIPGLLRLVGESTNTARPALASLVNMAQEPSAQLKLLELNAPSRCMDYLKDGICKGNEDLLVMLLANLTTGEEGASALLQLGKGATEGLNVAILLQHFLAPVINKDSFEHVASILPNITRFQAGRKVLLEPGKGTLRALASQLRSSSQLRRRGCAGAIKNCCFSCEEDDTCDAIANETEALQDVLSLLCAVGETERESDDAVRENLAETILCLAKVDSLRKILWTLDAPGLLQKGYEVEECFGVCEAMESIAELFLNDGFQPDNEGGDDVIDNNNEDGSVAIRGLGNGDGDDGWTEQTRNDVHIEEIHSYEEKELSYGS